MLDFIGTKLALFIAAAFFALSCVATPPPAESASAASERLRTDMTYLADDALEGREAGTRGYDAAADYVANRFAEIGLDPGASGEWMQTVPLRGAVRDLAAAGIVLKDESGKTALVHLEDFLIGNSLADSAFAVDAPLLFAGYGVTADGHDDYAGLDAAGKIITAFADAPASLDSEERAYHASRTTKLRNAAAHGAVGFIALRTLESEKEMPWSRMIARPEQIAMTWIEPDGRAYVIAPEIAATAILSEQGAAKLFAGERLDFETLRAIEADPDRPLQGFELGKSATIAGASKFSALASANIVALIEGADPRLKDEVVVLTAHLDHVGLRQPKSPEDDAIYNGALDNAAGVAALLETARAFKESGDRPRRTLLFVALTAEEKGLIGADYFVRNIALGDKKIVANVNLDMPLPLYPFTDVVAFGGERSTIGEVIREAAQSMDLKLTPDPIPEFNVFIRSDHYRFVEQGIPAAFLFTGFENGGEEAFRKFMAENYHRPSDELSLPIDYEALARFAELNYRIARRLADDPEAPRWNEGDFFGKMFAE